MRTVYFDVENTLNVPFITGIQRVTREFSRKILANSMSDLRCNYIPVVFEDNHRWRALSARERKSLVSDTPRSMGLYSRAVHKLGRQLPRRRETEFDPGSVFLDIESSWHSKVKRSQLLPYLKQRGVKLAKLHYDIIPILFRDTCHPNTVNVFEDHFSSHLKYSDLFLCISNSTLSDVEVYCKDNSLECPTLRTVRLGSNFTAAGKSVRHQPGNCAAKYGRYLLCVGTIEPRKNHLLLLNAFAGIMQTTDLNLVFVGKQGWMAADIMHEISSHPAFESRIFLLDSVGDAQLDNLYRSAWLNVVPSFYEGFGLPVVEALARGCPTICSDAGSLSEIARDSVVHFPPASEPALAEIIMTMYNSKETYSRLKSAAQNFVPTDWAQMVKDIDRGINDAFD